jgi:pyruvate/2-oxoglutarate dehydrogenase complex dihydrolipoamide acyltransferase (E2) component
VDARRQWIKEEAVMFRIAVGLVVGVLAAGTVQAQQATPPAQQAAAAPAARVFASDAGMVLNFIKPDKTADFEAVIAKLKEALQKSEKPERKQQAASWKVFKSPDPAAGGNALYVFIIDPAVKGAA